MLLLLVFLSAVHPVPLPHPVLWPPNIAQEALHSFSPQPQHQQHHPQPNLPDQHQKPQTPFQHSLSHQPHPFATLPLLRQTHPLGLAPNLLFIEETTVPEEPNPTNYIQGIQINSYGNHGIHKNPKDLGTLYYENTPKCSTVYEERNCEQSFKQECTEDPVCTSQCHAASCTSPPCTPLYSQQCETVYKQKCYKKYHTVYTEECTQTYDKLCTVIIVTKYVEDCSFQYGDRCTGYGGLCNQVPRKVCTQRPVTKEIEKCASVPLKSCSRIPLRKPENICKKVPVKKCKQVISSDGCYGSPQCPPIADCLSACKVCKNVPSQDCRRRPALKTPIKICDFPLATFGKRIKK